MENKRSFTGSAIKPAIAAIATLITGTCAHAVEFDTGNSDVSVRWDNTLRYTVAQRVGSRDNSIANNPLYDEGDYKFNRGDLVANRIDLLSELDVVYKKDYGFRVSAAGWYDSAYGDKDRSSPRVATTPSYPGNQYTAYTKRYYAGPSGEILDAFAFANFDMGNVPVKAKAGRHTVFWGESLFLNGALHSVSYAQMPLDLQKGFANPGTEAKELFRPLNQVSGQFQLTDELSVAGQYFLQWESYRLPEGGTYLGPADFGFNGPVGVFNGAYIPRKDSVNPNDRGGEWGLSTRWSPEFLDGTFGVYARRYADKLPQALRIGLSQYDLVYPDKIDLFGISLAKNIGGLSVGAELSYRRNTPLLARTLGAVPSVAMLNQGPRGNTYHGLINVLGTVAKTPVFDAASWAAELTWSRLDKVTSDPYHLFYSVGNTVSAANGCVVNQPGLGLRPGDKKDGCATQEYVGLGLSFTPTWYQVIPGVDLSAPITYSVGLKGNAATNFGGNENNGNLTVGIGADVFQKYRIDLKYVEYFGDTRVGNTGLVYSQSGFTTLLKDRSFVSLTLKTTF